MKITPLFSTLAWFLSRVYHFFFFVNQYNYSLYLCLLYIPASSAWKKYKRYDCNEAKRRWQVGSHGCNSIHNPYNAWKICQQVIWRPKAWIKPDGWSLSNLTVWQSTKEDNELSLENQMHVIVCFKKILFHNVFWWQWFVHLRSLAVFSPTAKALTKLSLNYQCLFQG
jgi:hypothetical protein